MSGFQARDDLMRIDRLMAPGLLAGAEVKVARKIEGYDQFSAELREDSLEMSEYYEVFYCLENTIRDLVSDILKDEFGLDWWNTSAVKKEFKQEVSRRQKDELDAGVSPRSDREIDYTTFGELGQLITTNWDHFAAVLNSRSGVIKIMRELNVLRGPIAHCCAISDLEKNRLELVVQNWLRLTA